MPDQRLRQACRRFRGKVRRLLFRYGLSHSLFLLLLAAAVLMAADWHFRFSPDGRLLSLLGLGLLAALCYYFDFHRPLRRSWSDGEILRYLDRATPGAGDAFTALQDLCHPEDMKEYETEEGKALVRSVVAELEARVSQVDVAKLVHDRPIRRWFLAAAALVAFYAASLALLRDPHTGRPYLWTGLARLLMPYALVYWPQDTRILVQEPESGWRVPKGEPLHIRARIDGVVPAVVEIVYKNDSGGLWITERMAVRPETGEAAFSFGEMAEPLVFYCTGGDDRENRKYTVTVAERPMLTAIKATYTYPAYARLPSKVVASGQLAGLEGTEVTLDFTASAKLAQASIRFRLEGEAGEKTVKFEGLASREFSHSFRLARNGAYTVELLDTENLKNGKPERYEIRVEPDLPPKLTLEEPARDVLLTSRGKLRVKFKAEDDYNLVELAVMLARSSTPGQALNDKVTGPFWNVQTTLHPLGEGDFELDFLKEKDTSNLQAWRVEEGAELELWVRALDCNPNPGLTETQRVRVSVLQPTAFMEEVILQAKELLADARTGWFAAAGAYHDAAKWLKPPGPEELRDAFLEQQQTAERSAQALALRFPAILEHMQRNRMFGEFMGKRLERIGGKIAELEETLPKVGAALAAGQPSSHEEEQPDKRRAKMAKAVQGVQAGLSRAGWDFRLLYDRLADWVALQSVLIKTRRIEEQQRELNRATAALVKKTLGLEKTELDDEQVREMKEATNRQQTVHDSAEAVEKELAQLILQAEKDGRAKVLEYLAKAFNELRKERVLDKLKRAALAIGDARGETVREDQERVLQTVAVLNRGLIKAGEEVPEDPAVAGIVEDPRGKTEEVAVAEDRSDSIDPELYKHLERVPTLSEAKADTLDATLEEIFRTEETVRNRTRHVGARAEQKKALPRYLRLRTQALAGEQREVVNLLEKAARQAEQHARAPNGETGQPNAAAPGEPDPAADRTRARLQAKLKDFLADAQGAENLLRKSDFGPLCHGVQDHVHRGAHDLRVLIQGTESLHKLYLDRKGRSFSDDFGRLYLLREENLAVAVDGAKDLEWALLAQASALRLAAVLGRDRGAEGGKAAASEAARIESCARADAGAAGEAAEAFHQALNQRISDPTEPERENEKVKPVLAERVLKALDLEAFRAARAEWEGRDFARLAQSGETLRRALTGAAVSLKDLFEERVPEKPPTEPEALPGETLVADARGFIEYRDELPGALADLLEKDAAWIDEVLGEPTHREALVRALRARAAFDPRYARLQSAYFQALAQHFQARARKAEDGAKAGPRKQGEP